ncbi:MAG: transporter ATP-binding protein YvcR [Pseudoduganella sp.]|jgi:ATP-binding cassette subfamily B protein|nr:transporter ATP-binding protein YvcR [Pseudoduganella sp.]
MTTTSTNMHERADPAPPPAAAGTPGPRGLLAALRHGPLGEVLRSPDLRRVAPGLALSALLSNMLSLGLPLAILQILDRVLTNQSVETLVLLVVGIIVALALEEVLRGVSAVVTGWLGIRYEHSASLQALERLLRVPMRRFNQEEAGNYAERILAATRLSEFYSGQALLVVFDLPFVLLFLFIILLIGGWVALVPAVLLGLFVAVSLRFGRRLSEQVVRRQELDDRRSSFMAEVLANIHTVKTQAMEWLMLRRYERLQEASAGVGEALTGSSARATDLGFVFSQVMVVAVVAAGAAAVMAGQMTPGGLAAVMLLSTRALQPLRRSLAVWLRYQSFVAAEERLAHIMDMPCEESGNLPPLAPLTQTLELRDVRLAHDDGRVLFDGLSLTVPAGQCVAIQGESGSGKSSLLALVNGLERPDRGQVLLDGRPLANCAPDSIHRQLAYLPQVGQIMAGTILDNLTMFDPALNQQALATARELGLDRVVAGMKGGYQTVLGEGQGEGLPEGVRQMIGIVRALVHAPSVILFDEANISLDLESDRRLQAYLAARKGRCTILMVTHRPSLLALADQVYTLAGGRLRAGRMETAQPGDTSAAPAAPAGERPAPQQSLADVVANYCSAPSDLGRCLPVLLEALAWTGQPRQLADALPHLRGALDLSGLCSALSNLGMQPQHFHSGLDDLDARLLPCLFLAPGAPAMVLLARQADGSLRVFDGATGAEAVLDGDAQAVRGEAYRFIAIEPKQRQLQPGQSWIGRLLWRMRKHLLLVLGLTVMSTGLALVPPLFVKTVFDTVIPGGDYALGGMLALGGLLMVGLDCLVRELKNRVLAYVGGRTEFVLSTSVFERVICLPATSMDGVSPTRQLERIKHLESLRDFFLGPLVLIAFELPASLVLLLALAAINAWVLLPIAGVSVAYAALWFGSRKWNESSMSRASQLASARAEFINEVLSGMRLIRSTGAAQTWLRRFHDVSGKAVVASFSDQQLRVRVSGLAQVLGMVTGLLCMALSAWLVIDGQLSGGALVATMMIVWRLTGPMQNLFLAANALVRTRANIRQVENLMRLPIERESGIKPALRPQLGGELGLARVSFRYANDADPVLLGLNFNVAPGEMVAIAGPNGSGKSTLLKLLVRVYAPQAGTIRLDGVDLRQLAAADLRSNVSYMPQQCEIFHGTVRQNLLLVHPAATEEEVRWAVDMAGLAADIASLPEGFETRISNSSAEQLPYGFRQRLMLARAMLKPAALVLMDEPGTGMDEAGEQALLRCIAWLRGRATLLVVSHRPGHMRMADRVVYMENGAVTAMGPFETVKNKVMAGLA